MEEGIVMDIGSKLPGGQRSELVCERRGASSVSTYRLRFELVRMASSASRRAAFWIESN